MPAAVKVFSDVLVVRLADAVEEGDTGKVEQVLREGVSVRTVGAGGLTITHFALLARKNAPAIMKLVLDAGADPVSVLANGETVPRYAVSRDDADPAVVEVLLDHGIDPNWQPEKAPYNETSLLIAAVSGHNLPVVRLLIKRGANINFVDPFEGSALHGALGGIEFGIAAVLVDAGIDLSLLNNTNPRIKNPRVRKETAMAYFCRWEAGKRGANPLPRVAEGWRELTAALARRGTKMPCSL